MPLAPPPPSAPLTAEAERKAKPSKGPQGPAEVRTLPSDTPARLAAKLDLASMALGVREVVEASRPVSVSQASEGGFGSSIGGRSTSTLLFSPKGMFSPRASAMSVHERVQALLHAAREPEPTASAPPPPPPPAPVAPAQESIANAAVRLQSAFAVQDTGSIQSEEPPDDGSRPRRVVQPVFDLHQNSSIVNEAFQVRGMASGRRQQREGFDRDCWVFILPLPSLYIAPQKHHLQPVRPPLRRMAGAGIGGPPRHMTTLRVSRRWSPLRGERGGPASGREPEPGDDVSSDDESMDWDVDAYKGYAAPATAAARQAVVSMLSCITPLWVII